MNFQEEYKLRCAVTSEEQSDILHLEVKCKSYQPQCYYKHITFKELPALLQSIFSNISHLFVYMNQPDMVYFDDKDSSIKICVPIAGQIREFPIKMQSKNRAEGLQRRIQLLKQAKAKSQDEFNKIKQQKENELEEMKRIILHQRQEKEELERALFQISNNTLQVDSQICQFNLQIEYQINVLKIINENESKSQIYNSKFSQASENQKLMHSQDLVQGYIESQRFKNNKQSNSDNQRKHNVDQYLQQRKQFWIKEIANLKKNKTLVLKQLINPESKFQQQFVVQINSIQLKKMLFLEVFQNLEIIDLSNNHIKLIEGLTKLKLLRKLDLSMNKIEAIKGLSNNLSLAQLTLHSNKIRKIENIFHLLNLKILSLSKNQIENVPDKICKLCKLAELKLGHNKINDVSDKVQLLKNLKVFTIVGNKCYSSNNKSKEIIDRLINLGIKTTQ